MLQQTAENVLNRKSVWQCKRSPKCTQRLTNLRPTKCACGKHPKQQMRLARAMSSLNYLPYRWKRPRALCEMHYDGILGLFSRPHIANFGLEKVIAWHSLLLSKAWGLAIASRVTGTILAILPMFYLELTKPIMSINNTLIGLISSAVTRSVYWEKCRREKHLLKIVLLNLNYASTKESYAKQARICACPL